MAVEEIQKSVKAVLKYEKGSQTISPCDKEATPDALFKLTEAVEMLVEPTVLDRVKISEVGLLQA